MNTSACDPIAAEPNAVPVVLYSSNSQTRRQVMMAVGTQPAPGAPQLIWRECATAAAVYEQIAAGAQLVIADGEATPLGGMGLCRQLKSEIEPCPPVLVLIARQADGWLADWSSAENVMPLDSDPMALANTVAAMLCARVPA